MTDSPRFPGISVLNPCFLEAVGHHVLALEVAAQAIARSSERNHDEVLQELLNQGLAIYYQLSPEALEKVTLQFITHAHKIAQQQN